MLISNAKELFVWASENIHGINFEFATNKEHEEVENSLKPRFNNLKTIKGTQQLHYFCPVNDSLNKIYASVLSSNGDEKKIYKLY